MVDPHLVGEKHIMDSPPADNIIDTTQCIHVHHEIHRALRGSARHRDFALLFRSRNATLTCYKPTSTIISRMEAKKIYQVLYAGTKQHSTF